MATLKPISARRLDAYRVLLELVALVDPFIARIALHDRELAEQLAGALPSIVQNFSEAMRRTGRDRAHLLTVALGSADEVRSIVDVAMIKHIITSQEAQAADAKADRGCAMLFRIRQRLA